MSFGVKKLLDITPKRYLYAPVFFYILKALFNGNLPTKYSIKTSKAREEYVGERRWKG
jgi:hypothetical protein